MPVNNPRLTEVRDEGASQGRVETLDFVGAGVSAAVSGTVATVTISGGAGGGLTYTVFTKDLGVARRSGTFDITGAGFTAGKVVNIVQTAGAIISKGNARDEPEMDLITVTGYVVDATTIRAYWNCAGGRHVAVGIYEFAYAVSA